MLYTPLAMEDIFSSQAETPWMGEWWIDGRLCLVRRDADGYVRLERLLSSDPQDFLDDRFQPNRIVATILF
ncbi:YlzJ-like family protein [Sulfobacillus thermosulfidooxidans]|uniref:YlzJ-like family protein n=1 Tax=Sulfobacillus thermosulfidooxidans TaxID=28034 RepID=UPI00041953C9|nr:YlzJ-like family protein [Sulfobacillus thermosulfidooxidans]